MLLPVPEEEEEEDEEDDNEEEEEEDDDDSDSDSDNVDDGKTVRFEDDNNTDNNNDNNINNDNSSNKDDTQPIFDNGVKDEWSEPTINIAMERMNAELKEFKQTDGGKIKSKTIRSAESLENEAKKMIREQSPTCDPVEKLAQYEMHERLHIEFENGNLEKCCLSFYLRSTTKKRRKLLYYMGSKMANDTWNDPDIVLPEDGLPVGLSMIPKKWRILADKGFTYVTRHFPNFNAIDTPARLGKRKYGRYSEEEGKSNKKKCKLRYTCEVYFARVTEEEVLKDRISYHNFAVLPHVHAWAHAAGNLREPLARPMLAPTDYFKTKQKKKKKRKTLIMYG